MTDRYVDELFELPAREATMQRYEVSRLVCDPERFPDDANEPMAPVGMGVVHTAPHDLGVLQPVPDDAEREQILARYYWPHHAAPPAIVEEGRIARRACLIVDAHSFPSEPLPYERAADDPERRWEHRPEICLGTDPFHTPPALREAALTAFSARFDVVEFDRPFSGTLVHGRYLGMDPRVRSIMGEVRRDLFMDEATGEKLPGFAETARTADPPDRP
jgi:N-formylglutamate amidohydrolase